MFMEDKSKILNELLSSNGTMVWQLLIFPFQISWGKKYGTPIKVFFTMHFV